jgi:hypothetical protein
MSVTTHYRVTSRSRPTIDCIFRHSVGNRQTLRHTWLIRTVTFCHGAHLIDVTCLSVRTTTRSVVSGSSHKNIRNITRAWSAATETTHMASSGWPMQALNVVQSVRGAAFQCCKLTNSVWLLIQLPTTNRRRAGLGPTVYPQPKEPPITKRKFSTMAN